MTETEAVPVTVIDLDGEPVEVLAGANVAYVMEMTGLTYKQLDYWSRKELLRPVQVNPGTGNVRYWTATEITVARIMGRLTSAGLPLDTAHEVARSGRSRYEIGHGVWIEVSGP